MRRTIKTAFLSLLCAGTLAHVAANDSDNWLVLDEDAGWSNVFYNAPYQPLDSLEPISVVMTGEKDADGYPIGDIYYNEGERCRLAVEDKFRYYTTLVYGVRGIGYGVSTGGVNPVALYTHPLTNKKTGEFDYGWNSYKDGRIVTPIQYLDPSKITFSGKCGRRKIGTFKEALKIAKDKSYYRARLTIDRQLWSDGLLTGDNVNNGYPIWMPHYDSVRLGRAYYYLYLSEPMVQRGYSCVGANCPTKKGTYYYDEINPVYSFTFDVGVQYYAPTQFQMQYRPWKLSKNGKYEASYWRNVSASGNYKSCLTYEEYDADEGYYYNPYTSCGDNYYTSFSVSAKRAEIVTEGDSLVEYRLAGITRIVEGPSKNGAHAMRIYDTTYSDIIKLVPKYKVHVDNGNYGHGYNAGESGCGSEEVAGKKCSFGIGSNRGYDFKCWSKTEENPKCISTENPLNLTVRHDTTLYAIYEETPLKIIKETVSLTETKYSDQYKAYQHVLGQDSLAFRGKVLGTTKDGYVAFEYNDGTNGWQRIGGIKKVPDTDLSTGSSYVYFTINKAGMAVGSYKNDTLGTKKFSKVTETKFRLALSYNSDFSAAVYSEVKTVRWLHPIAFYDLDKKLISDTVQLYGTTVYFPTDRALINVPADTNGIHYDYYWTDQNTTKYVSGTKSIKLEKDSLRVRSWLIEKYKVKFVDFDGTVLKDTLVIPDGSSVAPSVPDYAGLLFKGWNFKNASWSDRYNEVYEIKQPITVMATYEVKDTSVYEFTVTGLEAGNTAKDIKVKTPSNCFSVTKKTLWQLVDGEMIDVTVLESDRNSILIMDVDVSNEGDCANDSLVNIWRFYMNDTAGAKIYTVNGEAYNRITSFESRVFYAFKTDPEPGSSSSEKFVSSSSAKPQSSSSSVKAKSSSSSAKAKSSSSSAKAKSSSSKKSGKSSSSKGGKNAIAAAGQVPQFSLAAVGRSIQVAGARVGSVYAVHDMQGRVMQAGYVNSANFNLAMDRAGTYLVRIGNQTQTVKVK